MGFFKSLFGGQQESPEEQKHNEEARQFDVLKFDGVKALRLRQPDHAILCFDNALKLHEDLEIRDYLSQAYIMNNDMASALEQLDILMKAEPENIDIRLRTAHVHFMNEDYEAMTDVCEKAMAIDADNPATLFMLARAKHGMDKEDEAIEVLDKAIRTNEDFGEARLMRAGMLMRAGRTEEAEADAQWLLDAAPESEDVLLLCARIATLKGHDDEAAAYYNKVIEVNPFCQDAFVERAAVRKRHGDEVGYAEDMATAREMNPENDVQDMERKVQEAFSTFNPFAQ